MGIPRLRYGTCFSPKAPFNAGYRCCSGSGCRPFPGLFPSACALGLSLACTHPTPLPLRPHLGASASAPRFGVPTLGTGLVLCGVCRLDRLHVNPSTCSASEGWSPGPRFTGVLTQGRSRGSQVTGSSSSSALQPATPPICLWLAHAPPAMLPSSLVRPWAPGLTRFRGCNICGSLVRLPTHQPPHCCDNCKTGYRPAG